MAILPNRLSLLPLLFATSATAFACGDDPAKQFADAAPKSDAGADAAPDAPTNGPVEVTVLGAGGPIAGATVVFQNADDSVVASAITAANGVATQVMAPGGSVTVIANAQSSEAATVLAVKPGDKIKIKTNGPGVEEVFVNVTLTLPANSAGTYTVRSSCGPNYTSLAPTNNALAFSLPMSCSQSTFVVKREATSGSGGLPAATIVKANVTPTNGVYDLSDQTFANLITNTITGADVPTINFVQGTVAPIVNGMVAELDESLAGIEAPGFPTFSGTFGRVDSAAATKQTVDLLFRAGGQQLFVAIAPVGDYAFAGTSALLPWLTDVSWNSTGNSATFTTEVAGTAPINGAFVAVGFNRGKSYITHRVVAPNATALRFPVLPATLSDFNIVTGDNTFIEDAGLISSTGGYDALRQVFYVVDGPRDVVIDSPLPNAKATVSLFFNQRKR